MLLEALQIINTDIKKMENKNGTNEKLHVMFSQPKLRFE